MSIVRDNLGGLGIEGEAGDDEVVVLFEARMASSTCRAVDRTVLRAEDNRRRSLASLVAILPHPLGVDNAAPSLSRRATRRGRTYAPCC